MSWGDFPLNETLNHFFTTRAFATGIPTVLAGTPVLSVYEDANLTQITAGVTVTVDSDAVVGLNRANIVATSGNGYEVGKSYTVVITTGTVGGVSVVGEVVGEFTIGRSTAAVDLANGTDGLGAIKAETALILVDTGTTLQAELDAIQAAVITNAAGVDIAADIIAMKAETVLIVADTNELQTDWTNAGRLDAILDIIAADVVNIDGRQPTIVGDAVTLNAAGVDLIWNEVLIGAEHNVINSSGRRLREIQEAGGYSGGAVYIDTNNGTAGTINFENGLDTRPSLTLADANAIATSLGITRFIIASGSSITFAAAQENQEFLGDNWTLALGTQSISGSHIHGAVVSGIATSTTEVRFDHCEMNTCTLGIAHLDECDLDSTITLSAAGIYFFIHCHHGGTSIIDFGGAVLNTTAHVHDYNGALTVDNMGQAGTDTLHFDSAGGQLTLNASCTGGTVNFRGTVALVNNSSGMTINRGGDVVNDVSLVATPAQVLTQINSALDAAISELAQAQPTATPSIRTGIMLMYMTLRNKLDVQTSGTDALEIHNAAGTLIAKKLLTDATGDYSEALMVSGP